MTSLVTVTAQVLPFLPVFAAVLVWLLGPRHEKPVLAVSAVLTVVLATVLVQGAGAAHDDPRPFVVDPDSPALFPHSADNGFSSDHTVYAAAAALLVATVRYRLGLALLLVATIGGLARVAANVHHLQDIIAALLIAVMSVSAATNTSRWLQRRYRIRRGRSTARSAAPG